MITVSTETLVSQHLPGLDGAMEFYVCKDFDVLFLCCVRDFNGM